MEKIKLFLQKPLYKSIKVWHVLVVLIVLASLGDSEKKSSTNESLDILGTYDGKQPSYYMKNANGDDVIINGQRIRIPSSIETFVIAKDNKVGYAQTDTEDNKTYNFTGTYKILEESSDMVKIKCSLSDGKYSNQNITLEIYPDKKEAVAIYKDDIKVDLKKSR
tara:strand:- start:1996 stop:2487 length:492 start_codon:yes stop_codon:yes gene_type:complete